MLKKLQSLSEKQKIAIIVVVVVIAILAMGYFWVKDTMVGISKIGDAAKSVNLPKIDLPDFGKILPDIAQEENTEWKTYTNPEYGFEIQYPSHLTIESNDSKNVNIISQSDNLLFASNIQVDESVTDITGKKITLQSFADWIAQSGKNVIMEKIIVDGVDAIKITQDNTDASGNTTNNTNVIVRKNDKTYILQVLNVGYNSTKYQPEDFYKILSTFKFTN